MASGDYPEAGRDIRDDVAAAPSYPAGVAAVLSDTIREVAVPEPRADATWTWGAIRVGDCFLGGGTLRVFSDGTAHWRAHDMLSSSSDNAWGAQFEFFDKNGLSRWKFGYIWSPTLPRDHPLVWENNNQLFYPAELFPFISGVLMHSRC